MSPRALLLVAPPAALALLALTACAGIPRDNDAVRVWMHGLSDHADAGDYNERNEGLGIEFPITDALSFETGRYRNSHHRPTRYAWLRYEFARRGLWRFGAAMGTADNYEGKSWTDGNGRGIPMGGATIEYWRARLLLIPSDRRLVEVKALSFNAINIEW